MENFKSLNSSEYSDDQEFDKAALSDKDVSNQQRSGMANLHGLTDSDTSQPPSAQIHSVKQQSQSTQGQKESDTYEQNL
jgi:hypothetical protein